MLNDDEMTKDTTNESATTTTNDDSFEVEAPPEEQKDLLEQEEKEEVEDHKQEKEKMGVEVRSDSDSDSEDSDIEEAPIHDSKAEGGDKTITSRGGGGGGFSSGMSRSHSGGSNDQQMTEELANRLKIENAQIQRLRVIMVKLLMIVTLAVAILVYTVTAHAQADHANEQYEGAADILLDTFEDIFRFKLASIATWCHLLSKTTTTSTHPASSISSTTTLSIISPWPTVTIPNFIDRAATLRKQSGISYLHLNPVVSSTGYQRREWEKFLMEQNSQDWIDEAIQYQKDFGFYDLYESDLLLNGQRVPEVATAEDANEQGAGINTTTGGLQSSTASWPIWYVNETIQQQDHKKTVKREVFTEPPTADEQQQDQEVNYYLPTWQSSPVWKGGSLINENIWRRPEIQPYVNRSILEGTVTVGPLATRPSFLESKDEMDNYELGPYSQVYLPIYEHHHQNKNNNSNVVAVMVAWIHWMSYFQNILPSNIQGIHVVLHHGPCADMGSRYYTYLMDGETAQFLGRGDKHEYKQTKMKRTTSLSSSPALEILDDGTLAGVPLDSELCNVKISIYPTQQFYDSAASAISPTLMALSVIFIFVVAALLFCVYDTLVKKRHSQVIDQAAQTSSIVRSLFPENVTKRLLEQAAANQMRDRSSEHFAAPNKRLKGYLAGDPSYHDNSPSNHCGSDDNPIADLFPYCTVMFADIAGFTAWSSTRDPAQVFILLQTLYEAFDVIAKRRRVFKVETIGDSYVAVTGLPEPQDNHAIIMARFAVECMTKMQELVATLESRLGPDTGELSMRFGLHSGPVTAGVLRGERARFQLFGDTVNTAARMESTGIRGKIQVSQATADLLMEGGKQSWLTQRPGMVMAKGKGSLVTYFVNPKNRRGCGANCGASVASGSDCSADCRADINQHSVLGESTRSSAQLSSKEERLVDWIVDLLHGHMKKLVAKRRPRGGQFDPVPFKPVEGQTLLEEAKEAIVLPEFCKRTFKEITTYAESTIVDAPILEQLRDFVATIASMYHQNAFHNFEHACHVTMATHKFLKRIVTPDIDINEEKAQDIGSKLHDYTHGINTDPLTLLAILFSALVHDVDHRGVSNTQLAKEDATMGDKYNNKSVAEQNSLDISWNLLMTDRFLDLRNCLFSTPAEMKRFRQIVVNVVLATDIFDKELNSLRKSRWEKAFSTETAPEGEQPDGEQTTNSNSLRATIVIEHIIQASDVSHTMQHWHIYRKWNKKLFQELFKAYKDGRMEKNPAEFWYAGEIGFFDNYVIPLAKKLKECQVFGVSSDECLNYAIQNRNEWKQRGEQMLQEMMEDVGASPVRNKPSRGSLFVRMHTREIEEIKQE